MAAAMPLRRFDGPENFEQPSNARRVGGRLPRVAAVRMNLEAPRELHPLARTLFRRGGESGLGDDDVAAEREDLRSTTCA
jgi:hypothetical protein